MTSTPVAPAPIAAAERSLAPDLARGAMLLLIAIANVPEYLYGRSLALGGVFEDSSLLDRWVRAVELVFVTDRSRPMFAILYGFGIAIMTQRALARGAGKGRVAWLLTKRGLLLILFGMIHAVFIWEGDILAAYGITGLIALAFVFLRDRWVIVAASLSLAWMTLVFGSGAAASIYFGTDEVGLVELGPVEGHGYVESMVDGLLTSLALQGLALGVLLFVPLVAVGMLMQRHGWLEHPGEHLTGLRWMAAVGITVGVATGLPLAAVALGWWDAGVAVVSALTLGTMITGMAGGCGYVALFALLAHSWQTRRAARGQAGLGALSIFSDVGQRSLTCYLAQSLMFAPLLSAWGLGLANGMGHAVALLVAVAGWMLTLVLARVLAQAGNRGPFETVLRRLIYGRGGRA